MTNHVHLLVTPEREDRAKLMMKHLGPRYVQYIKPDVPAVENYYPALKAQLAAQGSALPGYVASVGSIKGLSSN